MSEEKKDLVQRLEELLKQMNPWEKKPVLKAGRIIVELVKLPERRKKSSIEPEKLVLHIRLEDAFRGIFIENVDELEDLVAAINAEKIREIARALTEISKKKRVQEYEL